MVRGELGFPLGAQLGELVADFARGAQALNGVEEVMRVAVLVEAAGGIVGGLALERADVAAEIQVAPLAGFDRVVFHGAHEFFEPRVFDALADLEVEVGAVQFLGETGFEFDFMRVLGALAEAEGLHPRTADEAGKAVEVRGAGAHAERFRGRDRVNYGQGPGEGEDLQQTAAMALVWFHGAGFE